MGADDAVTVFLHTLTEVVANALLIVTEFGADLATNLTQPFKAVIAYRKGTAVDS